MRNTILMMLLMSSSAVADERIRFNRDVRPILAEHCWQCHGFDAHARQSGLRLDDRDSALQPADSGAIAVVPHTPELSEMMRRISAHDAVTPT